MNSLRKMLCLVTALVFATFALPGMTQSPDKKFSINLTLAGSSITAVFKNETPNGNSSFNSIKLIVPATGGWTIPSPQTIVVSSGTVSIVANNRIEISNISPVKPNQSFSFTFAVAAPTTGCVSSNWSGGAWTGSSFSGDSFAFQPPLSNVTTGTSAGCTLRFVPGREPQDAIVGAIITSVDGNPAAAAVQVEAWTGSARATWFTGPVTLAKAPGSGSGTLSGGGPIAAGAGLATFAALSLNATGVYALTATSPGLTSGTSLPFTIYDGTLNCGDNLGLAFTNPNNRTITQTGFAEGRRSAFNKDGSPCVLVNYDFTNDIETTNTVNLKWDTGTQPYAAFSFTATWQDELIDPSTGLATRRTKVGFQVDGLGNPIYNYGVACLSSNLPVPYGTLTADNGATLEVNATSPLPATPFPIVIRTGIVIERLTVNLVAGTTWTVTRAEGGTTAIAHTPGAPVMSTPLPIDPNPTLADGSTPNNFQNKQVPMCIWDEGWTAVGAGKVRFTTSVFDIGDGWLSRQ